MRLLTFLSTDGPRAGTFVSDGTIMAIRDLVPGGPIDMLRVIEQFEGFRKGIGDAARRARGGVDPSKAKLLAPIPVPRRNVFCVGWNYAEHFQEGAIFAPDKARWASRRSRSIPRSSRRIPRP